MHPVGLLPCLAIPPALLYVAGGIALTRPDAGPGGVALVIAGSTMAVLTALAAAGRVVCQRLDAVNAAQHTHSSEHHHIAALTAQEVELLRRTLRQHSRLN